MHKAAYLLIAILALACLPVHGKVYKWVMPDGSIEYSDRPQEEGAKEAELPPLQLYSAPPAPAAAEEEKEEAPATVKYEVVEVISPKSGEVIRDNGGTISVQLKLEPALQSGHTVEILVDGKSVGSGRATSASVTNLDRGSHSVSAVIKDAEGGNVASAAGVSFELKRRSRLLPARGASGS
jgi:hypothetical protein